MTQSCPVVQARKRSPQATCLIVAAICAAALAVLFILFIVLVLAARSFLPDIMQAVFQSGLEHPAVGQKLVVLDLTPLTGDAEPIALPDLESKVVLINFWGTWCPPCRMELPHIAEIEKKYRDRPEFKLLAVSCGDEDIQQLRTDTEQFLSKKGITMPTYADQGEASRSAAEQLDAFGGYPTTIVLDRTGTIRGVWGGYMPGVEQEMEELVNNLLNEKASPEPPQQGLLTL